VQVLVILAHPDAGSLNHAIAAAAVKELEALGHRAVSHDLAREGFDPLLPAGEIPKRAVLDPIIRTHCEELALADGIVIVHPNWWGQPPAILTGWVDRVVRPGVAYEFLEGDAGEGIPRGLLRASTALVFNTSNTRPEREAAVFGDPLERLWKDCIFGLCGVNDVRRKTFGVVVTSTKEQRAAWLDEVRADVRATFPPDDARDRRGIP